MREELPADFARIDKAVKLQQQRSWFGFGPKANIFRGCRSEDERVKALVEAQMAFLQSQAFTADASNDDGTPLLQEAAMMGTTCGGDDTDDSDIVFEKLQDTCATSNGRPVRIARQILTCEQSVGYQNGQVDVKEGPLVVGKNHARNVRTRENKRIKRGREEGQSAGRAIEGDAVAVPTPIKDNHQERVRASQQRFLEREAKRQKRMHGVQDQTFLQGS